jgi:predicted transposase/invertase (TIGR01784 family)
LLIQALSQLPNREERQLVSMLFNFYEQLFNHNKISEVDWNALDKVRTDEENEMLLQNLKLWDKKAYLKGKLEGKEEGKLEGKLEGKEEGILVGKLEGKYEGKLETAKKMLMEGLSIALIAKVTGLTITEIEQLRH